MQFDDAIQILKRHEADLKRIGVNSLYIFGSTVRGDQREDSDVDMFSATTRKPWEFWSF